MAEKNLTNEEFFLIARELEIHHAVFSKLWNIGKPVFTDKIQTACVTFDKEGNQVDFQFNPEFWESITPYERNFVICHECLHIMLNHGLRLKELNRDIGNVAADVVINEMLVQGFQFERNKLNWVDKNGCWLDTVFKNSSITVEKNHSLEYYYNLLKKDFVQSIKNALQSGEVKIVDDHDGILSIDGQDLEDILSDVVSGMNNSEKESLQKMFKDGNTDETEESSKTAGSMPGNLEILIKVGFVKKKKKWETVIKRWTNSVIKNHDKDHEQWARVNRRFSSITSMMNNMFLPSEMEIEEREEEKIKIKVVFFMDTSSSCAHLAERFFRAAKSLDKKRFDVHMFCFDTRCYETTLESGKLYGFGGTSFKILEDKVIQLCKGDLTKYPKSVWVISDGYGDKIYPKKPKNWHWFLDPHYTDCIPKECNTYKLSDFE